MRINPAVRIPSTVRAGVYDEPRVSARTIGMSETRVPYGCFVAVDTNRKSLSQNHRFCQLPLGKGAFKCSVKTSAEV